MSSMNVRNSEQGSLNVLTIPLITAVILLFASLGFSVWAFAERQDYKDNSDDKAAAAVAVAVEQTKSAKDNEFLEREKQPLKDYTGPSALGGVAMQYPKTWSGYVTETPTSLSLVMQPGIVSGGQNVPYPLKIEVLSTSYNTALSASDAMVKQGKAKSSAYALPKVPSVVGLRFDGEIGQGKRGAVVYLPLRDKTIKISTESEDRIADFNNIILPNLSFQP